MNLPTASNILFLYNKVNSLLSPWHRTPAIVSQSSFQAGSHELHLYAADSPCPNSAGFSLVSLPPRRDPSAAWAIKQSERSHFRFITTDCRLFPPAPTPSSLDAFWFENLPAQSPPLLRRPCVTDFLLGSCAQKAHCAGIYKQYVETYCGCELTFYAHTLVTQTLAGHRESTISVVFTYRSLPCYPQSFILPHTDKQWDGPDQNLQLLSWASWAVCYIHLFIFRPYWFMPARL